MAVAGEHLSFSRCVSRPTRRPCRSRSLFRKTSCSGKRTYQPANRLLSARGRTTNLGPFGEVIRVTGPMAKVNPFRFSTKYQDDESDLVYYGYRYYNASTGRWLSRDPIGEKGGINLYVLVGDDPIDKIDLFGQRWYASGPVDTSADTIVCDGKGGIEVYLTPQSRSGCSAARSCRMKHENSHAADALTANPNVCGCKNAHSIPRNTQVNATPSSVLKASERKAYAIEIQCVKDTVASGGWDCDGSAADYIKALEANAAKYQ